MSVKFRPRYTSHKINLTDHRRFRPVECLASESRGTVAADLKVCFILQLYLSLV